MKKTILVALAVSLALIAALAFVASSDRWPPVEEPPRQGEALDSFALESDRFVHSEQALARLVREPQNTWSNLAFVFAGAYLASAAFGRSTRLVGLALIAVGMGSFLYHASASRTLRHADVAAMYGLFFTIALLSAGSFHRRIREKIEAHFMLLTMATLFFAVGAAAARNFMLFGVKPLGLTLATAATATLMIASLTLAAIRSARLSTTVRAGLAIACFTTAVVCQIGDRPGGWLCAPDSIVQAHALWHVLSALALVLAACAFEEIEKLKPAKPTALTRPSAHGSGPHKPLPKRSASL